MISQKTFIKILIFKSLLSEVSINIKFDWCRHRWTGRYEAHLWDNSCRREGQARKGRQGIHFLFLNLIFILLLQTLLTSWIAIRVVILVFIICRLGLTLFFWIISLSGIFSMIRLGRVWTIWQEFCQRNWMQRFKRSFTFFLIWWLMFCNFGCFRLWKWAKVFNLDNKYFWVST